MNEPHSHFCPKCSKSGFQSKNDHRFDCPDCGFQFFKNVASTTAFVLRCGDEILFSERGRDPAKGLLDFPGGFVDPGETLEAALIRELSEELDWTPDSFQYLFSCANTYLYAGVTYRTVDAFFASEVTHKPDLTPLDDVASLVWRPLAEIKESELAFVSMKNAVNTLKEMGY